MARLDPSAARLEQIKGILRHETTSSEHGDRAAELLEQLSNVWAVAPQTAQERNARKQTYNVAVRFLYDHDLM
jgi:hypothetical protein